MDIFDQSLWFCFVAGVCGPMIVDDNNKGDGKRLHLETKLDPVYKPEDLCVNVDSNRVVISGKRCKSAGRGPMRSASIAEFKQSYQIPETVDPLSVRAQLIGDTLVLEAPLRKQHKVEAIADQR